MSLYASGDFGYLQQVEAYFLSHTRVGVMLSSLDIELLRQWRSEGIPVEAVCAGIKQTFLNFDEPPRSIHQCRHHIQDAIQDWLKRRDLDTGQPTSSPEPLPGRDLPDPTRLHGGGPRRRRRRRAARQPAPPVNAAAQPADVPEEEVLLRSWHQSMATLAILGGDSTCPELIRDTYRWAWRQMVDLRRQALEVPDPHQLMAILPLAIGEIEAGMFELAFERCDTGTREALDQQLTPNMRTALKRMSPEARERQIAIWRRRIMEERLGLKPFFTP